MERLDRKKKIYVAGHRGLVGSAFIRGLKQEGFEQIITRTHTQLDLTRQQEVEEFFQQEKPDFVILAAAKVGGIHANNIYPADFIRENLQIQCNVIDLSLIHISEPTRLRNISYAVFCLKKIFF